MSAAALPEGTVLSDGLEIWRDLADLPAGRLYTAVASGPRPRMCSLLARSGDGPTDLRAADWRGETIPALDAVVVEQEQCLLVLDCQATASLASAEPPESDLTAAAALRQVAAGLAELDRLDASTRWFDAEHLWLRPDGSLVYVGPVVPRTADEPAADPSALVARLLPDETPWSAELSEAAGRLAERRVTAAELAALAAGPPLAVRVGLVSDAGVLRASNEDAALHLSFRLAAGDGDEDCDLLAVADGMGGHRDGAAAARVGLTTFASSLSVTQAVVAMAGEVLCQRGNRAVKAALDEAYEAAEETVSALAEEGESAAPGTTLVAALRLGSRLFVANVGDSRAYLLRDGRLTRLTRDDSLVQAMIDRGEITEEEAYGHPKSAVITHCLGHSSGVRPRHTVRLLRPGDRLMLCSDGVTEQLRDRAMEAILAEPGDPAETAERLIHAAAESGARDNLTAVVMVLEAADA